MPEPLTAEQLVAVAGGVIGTIAPAVADAIRRPIDESDEDHEAANDSVKQVDTTDQFLDPRRGCEPPPGTRGTYGALRRTSSPECNAHHIIQDAAARNIPGYSKNAAPGIVLTGPSNVPGTQHYFATQAQRAATVGGTYGAERQVAVAALVSAGVPEPIIRSAIQDADDYFMGQLGLTDDSPMRLPGNRWGYGR